jgi:ribonuclease HII
MSVIIGVDECGTGSFVGPLYVGATIFDKDIKVPDNIKIGDSKKLSMKKRNIAYEWIINNAKAYSIEFATEEEIDKYNILQAKFIAWHRALDSIKISFDLIMVDGKLFKPYKDIPYQCIVKGDSLIFEISCASIIAKVTRDRHMIYLSNMFPYLDEYYGLRSNFGYGSSKIHQEGLKKYGPSIFHRITFKPCKNTIKKISKNIFI